MPRGLQLLHAPAWWHRHSCLCTSRCIPCMVHRQEWLCHLGINGSGDGNRTHLCRLMRPLNSPEFYPATNWSGSRDSNPGSRVPETRAFATRPLPVKLVGMRGFEPPPPCPQDRWATVTLHPENLERLAGIEPVVESLEDSHSAIELQPRILERSAGIEPAPRHWQCQILPLNHDRPIWCLSW